MLSHSYIILDSRTLTSYQTVLDSSMPPSRVLPARNLGGGQHGGARRGLYNPEHHQRIKHIERRHFFVREAVENMQITVPHVNTLDNIADFFTKSLPPASSFYMRDIIMNVPGHERHQRPKAVAKSVKVAAKRARRMAGGQCRVHRWGGLKL